MEVRKNGAMRAFIVSGFLLLASLINPAFAGPVNINTADAATIAKELVNVGPKTAEAIVAYRDEHGPFKSVDDLKNVKGVGDKTIEKNEGNILLSE